MKIHKQTVKMYDFEFQEFNQYIQSADLKQENRLILFNEKEQKVYYNIIFRNNNRLKKVLKRYNNEALKPLNLSDIDKLFKPKHYIFFSYIEKIN